MRSKRYKSLWFRVCPWNFFLLYQLRFGQPCPFNSPFPAGSDRMGHPWHENQILSRSLMLNTQKMEAVGSLWIFFFPLIMAQRMGMTANDEECGV